MVVMPEAVTSEASRRRGRRPDMVDLSNPTEPLLRGLSYGPWISGQDKRKEGNIINIC